MKLPAYLRVLTLAVIAGSTVFAQTQPVVPVNPPELPSIPLEEAERHLLESKPPLYPPIAKVARVEGDVHLTLQIGSDGAVMRVVQSFGHPLLLQAAIAAARQYRYRPFELNGVPMGVLVTAVVSFSLYVPAPPPVPFPEITNLNSVVMEFDNGWTRVRVNGNGLVEYKGSGYVAVEGEHQRRMTAEEVKQLMDAFRKADFFSLRDDYSVGATDVGSTATSIQIGNVRKAIIDDWVAVPPALKSVQDAILKYSHSDQWVKGNADTIRDLLVEAPSPSARKEVLAILLPRAARYSDTSVVREIVASSVDLERRGPYQATALMLAADRGIPDMVGILLKAGANPRVVDEYGRGALLFGAGSGNTEVVRLLLAAGLKGNAKDKYGDSALMAAAASGNPECVRLLLASGATVNAKNKRRQNALLSGAQGDPGFSIGDSDRGHAEVPEESIDRAAVVRLLLDAGANINARDWDGETALFSLEEDVVQELINHHINLEVRDNYGQTALIETVAGSIAELLIKSGANVNAQDDKGKTALIMAAGNNELDKLKVLLKVPGVDFERRDKKGETALMKAKAARLQEGVRLLLAAGAVE